MPSLLGSGRAQGGVDLGQGLYNLLGYGLLEPMWPKKWDEISQLEDDLADLHLQIGSETEPFYLVVPLAVDDEGLQRWWKLPALPDEVLLCAPRRARYADEVTYPVPHEAKARWREAQALYAAQGLTLGEGKLIVLNDWD